MRRLTIALAFIGVLIASAASAEVSYGFGLGGQFGVPNTTGSFNDHVDYGAGVHSHLRFHVTDRASIYGSTGFVAWNKGREITSWSDTTGTVTVRDYDCIPVMIGVQCYLRGESDTRFYVSAEMGMRFFNINVKQRDVDEDHFTTQLSQSDTKLCISPGFGVTRRLGDYMYIDAAARIEYVPDGLSYASLCLTLGYRQYPEY